MNCELCGSQQQDEIQYGQFIRRQNKAVHMNCLYFSSGLQRLDREDNGFYGYLPDDILKQRRLFNNKNCCYCNKKTANISCSNKDCQRTFHLICGIIKGARNQFVAPYRSYCHRHVKLPKHRPKPAEYCCICYDKLLGESVRFNPGTMLRAPCCRDNWFHKLCLQKFAHSSGNLFRCPVCNNRDTFPTTMRYWGVFVQDNVEQQNEEEIEEPVVINFQNEDDEEDRFIRRMVRNREEYEERRIRLIRMINQELFHAEQEEEDGDDEEAEECDEYEYVYGSNLYTVTYERKGLGWLNWIADNVLSHPFIVLRQQCQVNVVSRKFHLLPFSLVPIIIQLYTRQGGKTFWKGFGFSLIFKCLSLLLEKEYFPGYSLFTLITRADETSSYIIRKCIDVATLGLKRSILMNTVGSLLAPNVYATSHNHKISLKSLFLPYFSMELAKDVFSSRIKTATWAFLHKNSNCGPCDFYEKQKMEIHANLISRIITEVSFYPLETVLHRLMLQGTGTFIDNLDNGKTVQPISTVFQGVQDCYRTIFKMEGYSGFYKGFGALIMQFSVHTIVIKIGMLIFP